MSMINFSVQEFNKLYDIVGPYLTQNWNVGRGKRCNYKQKDVLFMFLSVMKFGGSWEKLANMFHAKYATDVVFQQANKVLGNTTESNFMKSGKHQLYGYKTEVSVLPIGLAINSSEAFAGSIADITIFRENMTFHKDSLQKLAQNPDCKQNELHADKYSDMHAVLVDKGYYGLLDELRAIYPHKKPIGGILSAQKVQFNRKKFQHTVLKWKTFSGGRMAGE